MKKIVVMLLFVLTIGILATGCGSSDEEMPTPTNTDPGSTETTSPTDGTSVTVTEIPTVDWTSTETSANESNSGWKLYLLPISLIKSSTNVEDVEISKIVANNDAINNTNKYSVNTFVGYKIDGVNHVYAFTAKDLTAEDNNTEVVVYVTEDASGSIDIKDSSINDMDYILGVEKDVKSVNAITEIPPVIQAMELSEEEAQLPDALLKENEDAEKLESTEATDTAEESTKKSGKKKSTKTEE